jgi:hypothetical protein
MVATNLSGFVPTSINIINAYNLRNTVDMKHECKSDIA